MSVLALDNSNYDNNKSSTKNSDNDSSNNNHANGNANNNGGPALARQFPLHHLLGQISCFLYGLSCVYVVYLLLLVMTLWLNVCFIISWGGWILQRASEDLRDDGARP